MGWAPTRQQKPSSMGSTAVISTGTHSPPSFPVSLLGETQTLPSPNLPSLLPSSF